VALALGLVSLGLNPSLVAGNPRSVVLVAVDTLRMDRTSLAPTDARTRTLTPALEALSKRAAVFTEATTQAPWTLPAFASVLTGRYPAEHGASSLQGRLRPGEQTLAEVMREAGYQTAGVVSHLFLDRRRGMAQGFAHFDESNILGDAEITGEGVTDAALAWLARRDEDPFFLLVHYFDPHYEYRDHADWDFADPSRSTLDLRDLHIYDLRARLGSLAPEDVRFLRDLYDEEVAFTDRTLGRLLEAVPEDAVLIVVGDHGEELLERGWLGHTVSLRREVVRVPLVVRLPGVTAPGAHIPGVVETRAVHGTVLDYLEIADATRAPRATLLPMLRGDGPPLETVFSQVWLPDEPVTTGKRVRRSLARQDRWLLIRDHDRAEDRLYSVDRLRGLELPVDAPAKQEELAAELDAWTRRMDAVRDETPTRALSEEERRQLEALGYL
jgi:arylsulfatase A-like enzyme